MLVSTDDAPLDGVALVLDQLFMNSMCDERDGFAREAKVGAQGERELFGRERGEQVPFNVVE